VNGNFFGYLFKKNSADPIVERKFEKLIFQLKKLLERRSSFHFYLRRASKTWKEGWNHSQPVWIAEPITKTNHYKTFWLP
jgi:hypothetical protein